MRDGYEHFDRGTTAGKKCPLYDDRTIDRHVQEANEAEERAIQEAKAEDGTIEENTLRIETGKGKAVDRQAQPDPVQAGPYRGIQHLAGQIFNAGAYRDGAVQPDNRNILWIQGLHQQLVPGPPPVIPGVIPPGRHPMQPVGVGGFNPPLAPPNFGQAFANPLGHEALGRGQIPGMPEFGPYHYYPAGFGTLGQPPQHNDPNIINNTYMATAQRVHEARHQLGQRRRSQIERRNTLDDTPLQAPNPEILNVRNAQNRIPPWHLHIPNNGLDNGAQRPQERVADARPRAVMANAAQNKDNADKDNNEVFADYRRAHEAFLHPRRAQTIPHDQNQGPNTATNQPQASAFWVQSLTDIQPRNQNRTQEWVVNQTAAPPTWGMPPENHIQNNNNGNAGASGSDRSNRRPATTRKGEEHGRIYPWPPTKR